MYAVNKIHNFCYGSFHNLLTYGRTKQHAIFTFQTSITQFIGAPEDGPVGLKHVELSKHIVNKYSSFTKVVYLVGLHM